VCETIKMDNDMAKYLWEESGIKRFKRATGTLLAFDEKLEIMRLFTNLRISDEEYSSTTLMDTVGKAMQVGRDRVLEVWREVFALKQYDPESNILDSDIGEEKTLRGTRSSSRDYSKRYLSSTNSFCTG